ncbi:unnamed protein product [Microthlaspi erraticum]|uniref:Uncharacterized protein n=1 Tax=Microthlaspi erraticum TaxID=1685480 RepID=A0A6D2JG96_9BRAS|nr:unnamed protein product [Microthlaspi erraticum]
MAFYNNNNSDGDSSSFYQLDDVLSLLKAKIILFRRSSYSYRGNECVHKHFTAKPEFDSRKETKLKCVHFTAKPDCFKIVTLICDFENQSSPPSITKMSLVVSSGLVWTSTQENMVTKLTGFTGRLTWEKGDGDRGRRGKLTSFKNSDQIAEPRATESYFSEKIDYLKDKVQTTFVKDRRAMKRAYEEYKVRFNSLVIKLRRNMYLGK